MCNVKPPIKPMPRSRRSLWWFFFLYISTHITTYLVVFPCILIFSKKIPLKYIFKKKDCDIGALVILYVIFTVFTMIFMLLSWLKDPGYIPKGTDKKEFLVNEMFNRHIFYFKFNIISKKKLLVKYESSSLCPECEILKPLRSRHCEVCNQCVRVFDHHCPWINNCVAAK